MFPNHLTLGMRMRLPVQPTCTWLFFPNSHHYDVREPNEYYSFSLNTLLNKLSSKIQLEKAIEFINLSQNFNDYIHTLITTVQNQVTIIT